MIKLSYKWQFTVCHLCIEYTMNLRDISDIQYECVGGKLRKLGYYYFFWQCEGSSTAAERYTTPETRRVRRHVWRPHLRGLQHVRDHPPRLRPQGIQHQWFNGFFDQNKNFGLRIIHRIEYFSRDLSPIENGPPWKKGGKSITVKIWAYFC